jgi:hypothetical protein
MTGFCEPAFYHPDLSGFLPGLAKDDHLPCLRWLSLVVDKNLTGLNLAALAMTVAM